VISAFFLLLLDAESFFPLLMIICLIIIFIRQVVEIALDGMIIRLIVSFLQEVAGATLEGVVVAETWLDGVDCNLFRILTTGAIFLQVASAVATTLENTLETTLDSVFLMATMVASRR
jgi:hypothetical protein